MYVVEARATHEAAEVRPKCGGRSAAAEVRRPKCCGRSATAEVRPRARGLRPKCGPVPGGCGRSGGRQKITGAMTCLLSTGLDVEKSELTGDSTPE